MNVKYHCNECRHSVFAPPGGEPPCRENRGDACVMEQVEGVTPKPTPPTPKKVTHGTSK